MKAVMRFGAVFAATLTLLWLLLFLTAKLPNEALRQNYEKSVWHYADQAVYESQNGGKLNAIKDNYADAIWLNVAWHMGQGGSLVTHYYNGETLGENAGLYRSVFENAAPNTDYTRYWHGTALFIRLLHLFTDVQGIKTIGFLTFLLLAGFTLVLLGRRHLDLAVLLTLSLCAVQIWNIRLSMEYQPAFLVAFLLLPAALLLERRGDIWLELLSVIGGVSVAFFDFLTTETVTLLLPLAVVIAVRGKEERLGTRKETLFLLVRCGILWLVSYGGTFLVKWAAVSLLARENAIASAVDFASVRMLGGTADDPYNSPAHFFSCILANLTVLFGGTARVQVGRVVLGLSLTTVVLLSVWYLFRKKEPSPALVPLLGLGSLVFLRFLVLNNHSYVHEFFVYRALVSTIFSVLGAVWLSLKRNRRRL
ncbi:MAG: hypothetical protein IJC88_01380 [Oscillospiraceae bacterium]|nr:hypothetical protein [Oscillospiraceae bacterium]